MMSDFNLYGSNPWSRRSSLTMDPSSGNFHFDPIAQAQVGAAFNQTGISNGGSSDITRRMSLEQIADQFPSFRSSSLYFNEPWNAAAFSRSNSLDFQEATNITDSEIEQLVSEIQNSTSSNIDQRRNSLESVIRCLSSRWAGKASCNDPLLVESRSHALRRLSLTILNAYSSSNTGGDVSRGGPLSSAANTADVMSPNQASSRAKRRMSSLSMMASLIECPPDVADHYHNLTDFSADASRMNENKRYKETSAQHQQQQQRRSTLDLLASTLLANETAGSNAGPPSNNNNNMDPPLHVSSLASFGMPRFSTNALSRTNELMPNDFLFRPTVQMQALSFQSLSASMKATEESKRLIEEWDKHMGLKRSHSVTVRNTARSRKMLQELMMSGLNH